MFQTTEAKHNWLPYQDSSKTGLRANWAKLFSGLGLTAFGGAGCEMFQRGMISLSFVAGFMSMLALVGTIVLVVGTNEYHNRYVRVVQTVVMVAAAIAAGALILALVNTTGLGDLIQGVLAGLAYALCLGATTLTRWWPPYGRETKNFFED